MCVFASINLHLVIDILRPETFIARKHSVNHLGGKHDEFTRFNRCVHFAHTHTHSTPHTDGKIYAQTTRSCTRKFIQGDRKETMIIVQMIEWFHRKRIFRSLTHTHPYAKLRSHLKIDLCAQRVQRAHYAIWLENSYFLLLLVLHPYLSLFVVHSSSRLTDG